MAGSATVSRPDPEETLIGQDVANVRSRSVEHVRSHEHDQLFVFGYLRLATEQSAETGHSPQTRNSCTAPRAGFARKPAEHGGLAAGDENFGVDHAAELFGNVVGRKWRAEAARLRLDPQQHATAA